MAYYRPKANNADSIKWFAGAMVILAAVWLWTGQKPIFGLTPTKELLWLSGAIAVAGAVTSYEYFRNVVLAWIVGFISYLIILYMCFGIA